MNASDPWIRIRVFGRSDTASPYRVEAELDDGSWFVGQLVLGDTELTALFTLETQIRDYGLCLGRHLFYNEIQTAYEIALGRARERTGGRLRVQLWISSECSELHAVMWERVFIELNGQAASLASAELTPFSRFTRLSSPEQAPITERPLKLLVAVANPTGLPEGYQPIDVEAEVKNLADALAGVDDLTVTLLPGRTSLSPALRTTLQACGIILKEGATTLEALQHELVEHHMLHYLGHGRFQRDRATRQGVSLLLLEGDDGSFNPTPDDKIVQRLAARAELPRLIFLAACDTARRDQGDPHPYVGLGPKLVEAGFPAVVAMQAKVPMSTASKLTANFYRSLLGHGLIDRALNEARWFLLDEAQTDWAIPVLFMRLPAGRLFAGDPVRQALQAIKATIERTPYWRRTPLPLEAVALAGQQVTAMWERTVLQTQARVDLWKHTLTLVETATSPAGQLIALTGERGMARSTHLQRLVHHTAEQSLRQRGAMVLPIYVDLQQRLHSSVTAPRFESLLLESLNEFWPDALTEDDLQRLLNAVSPKLRIIFDHGDDLPEAQRYQVGEEARRLVDQYPQHQCLISMERGCWNLQQLPLTDLVDVQLLSRHKVELFLRRQLTPVEERRDNTASARDAHTPSDIGARLADALDDAQLFDLAAMPWLLERLIAQADRGTYPMRRYLTLQGWVEERVAQIPQASGQQSRALESLYALARTMQLTRRSRLSVREAFAIMAGVRANREYSLEDLLDNLYQQGLLARAEEESIRFLYPSLQAYCCACALFRENDRLLLEDITACLGRLTHLRWWAETLVLLCGMLRPPDTLLDLITHGATLTQGEQVFLAARCILEAGYSDTSNYVTDQVLDALVWRASSANEPRSYQRLRAVQALGQLRRPEIVPYLVRITMAKTRQTWDKQMHFDYGSIRQAAGRALRRLTQRPPASGNQPDFKTLLTQADPDLGGVIDLWMREDIAQLAALMLKNDEDRTREGIKAGLPDIAAFALSDLQDDEARATLHRAFKQLQTDEDTRWAITDALLMLDPDEVMEQGVLPLITNGALPVGADPEQWCERLIYLIGRLRTPEPRARAFVEGFLQDPQASVFVKGRAMLTLSFLDESKWKDCFEQVALGQYTAIGIHAPVQEHYRGYLCEKALQALAEIGDRNTLELLRSQHHDWTPEIEQVFYVTSEEINWRMSAATSL